MLITVELLRSTQQGFIYKKRFAVESEGRLLLPALHGEEDSREWGVTLTPIILDLGKQRQEEQEVKGSHGCITSPRLS